MAYDDFKFVLIRPFLFLVNYYSFLFQFCVRTSLRVLRYLWLFPPSGSGSSGATDGQIKPTASEEPSIFIGYSQASAFLYINSALASYKNNSSRFLQALTIHHVCHHGIAFGLYGRA